MAFRRLVNIGAMRPDNLPSILGKIQDEFDNVYRYGAAKTEVPAASSIPDLSASLAALQAEVSALKAELKAGGVIA